MNYYYFCLIQSWYFLIWSAIFSNKLISVDCWRGVPRLTAWHLIVSRVFCLIYYKDFLLSILKCKVGGDIWLLPSRFFYWHLIQTKGAITHNPPNLNQDTSVYCQGWMLHDVVCWKIESTRPLGRCFPCISRPDAVGAVRFSQNTHAFKLARCSPQCLLQQWVFAFGWHL